jgi:pantetheine-phosphate adenylyltransferase
LVGIEGEDLMTEYGGEPRVCVYAGSFDPPTQGHMFMIEKGAGLFDRLIVSVGINPNKHYSFTVEDRLEMLRECTEQFPNVEVDSFEGQFLMHYAREKGAGYIMRGIRSDEDYRFEHAMRNVNADLEPGITTIFLIPPREICEVSSSFVKGLAGFEGWEEVVRPYVPEPVYRRLVTTSFRWTEHGSGAEGGSE